MRNVIIFLKSLSCLGMIRSVAFLSPIDVANSLSAPWTRWHVCLTVLKLAFATSCEFLKTASYDVLTECRLFLGCDNEKKRFC